MQVISIADYTSACTTRSFNYPACTTRSQIGEMKTASEEAKAALAEAAEATAQQCKSSKEAFSASETAVAVPSAGINYVLFGVIVVFAAMAWHKYFGASLF